jgi:hypothetical protein
MSRERSVKSPKARGVRTTTPFQTVFSRSNNTVHHMYFSNLPRSSFFLDFLELP